MHSWQSSSRRTRALCSDGRTRGCCCTCVRQACIRKTYCACVVHLWAAFRKNITWQLSRVAIEWPDTWQEGNYGRTVNTKRSAAIAAIVEQASQIPSGHRRKGHPRQRRVQVPSILGPSQPHHVRRHVVPWLRRPRTDHVLGAGLQYVAGRVAPVLVPRGQHNAMLGKSINQDAIAPFVLSSSANNHDSRSVLQSPCPEVRGCKTLLACKTKICMTECDV